MKTEHLQAYQWLILRTHRWQRQWIPHIQTVCLPGYPNREWMGKLEDMKNCLKETAERLDSGNPDGVRLLMLNFANQSLAEITCLLENHFYSDEILQ